MAQARCRRTLHVRRRKSYAVLTTIFLGWSAITGVAIQFWEAPITPLESYMSSSADPDAEERMLLARTVSPTPAPTFGITPAPTFPQTLAPPTLAPTLAPTMAPTMAPTIANVTVTLAPTLAPTLPPTIANVTLPPTIAPTLPATIAPTAPLVTIAPSPAPTIAPTPAAVLPTAAPTLATTIAPTVPPTRIQQTAAPTLAPTLAATVTPTIPPTRIQQTAAPTLAPTLAETVAPTVPPTRAVKTLAPTLAPTLAAETVAPTVPPTRVVATLAPTLSPTVIAPTKAVVTAAPTLAPTLVETVAPTIPPTLAQVTIAPTIAPTIQETIAPTPAAAVTLAPTVAKVTLAPTIAPTILETVAPTIPPTLPQVTIAPTIAPTIVETIAPTPANVTVAPTVARVTLAPTLAPTIVETIAPTPANITIAPTVAQVLTVAPSIAPTGIIPNTVAPTPAITVAPTIAPTVGIVTTAPTLAHSLPPSIAPTVSPVTVVVTPVPTLAPTPAVTIAPTRAPAAGTPDTEPTASPTQFSPTLSPSITISPTVAPTFGGASREVTPAPTVADTPTPSPATVDIGSIPIDKLMTVFEYQDNSDASANENVARMATSDSTVFIVGNRAPPDNTLSTVLVKALTADSGTEVWSLPDGLGSGDGDSANAVYATGDTLIVAGSTGGTWFSPSAGGADLLVLQLSPTTGSVTGGWQQGGPGDDFASAVVSDSVTGDLVLGASIDGVATLFRSNGTVTVWSIEPLKGYAVNGTTAVVDVKLDEGTGVVTAASSNVNIVPGDSTTTAISQVHQVAFNSGEAFWSKAVAGEVITSVAVDATQVVTAGFSGDTIVVRAYSVTDGAAQWGYTGRKGWASAVAFDANSNPIIVGSTTPAVSGRRLAAERSDKDIFVLTLDQTTGAEVCYYSFGSTDNDVATDLAPDATLGVTVSGYTTGSLFADSSGKSDSFAVYLDQEAICSGETQTSNAPAVFTNANTGSTTATVVNTAVIASVGSAVATSVVASTSAGVITTTTATTGATVTTTSASSSGMASTAATTAALLVVFQLQFLCTTNVVSGGQSTQLTAFTDSLSWVNLWVSDPTGTFVNNEECASAASAVEPDIFVGNTITVLIITVGLFIFHAICISGIEGMWLAKDAHTHRVRVKREKDIFAETQREMAPASGSPEARSPITSGESSPKVMTARDVTARDLKSRKNMSFNEEEESALNHIRQRSKSIWLYFPHIELLFMLFVFSGSTTVEVAMLSSPCIAVVITSCIMLALYCGLLLYVGHKVFTRLRSNTIVYIPEELEGDSIVSMCIKAVKSGWGKGESIFSVADLGSWHVPPDVVSNKNEKLKRRDFLISYAPLYSDFTANGAFYMMYNLVKFLVVSIIVGVAGETGWIALSMIAAVYFISLIVVLVWQPFSNAVLQCMEVLSCFADITCLCLQVVGSKADDASLADILSGTYLIIQAVLFFILVVPMYIDTVVVVVATLVRKRKHDKQEAQKWKGENNRGIPTGKPPRAYTSLRFYADFFRFWLIMMKSNIKRIGMRGEEHSMQNSSRHHGKSASNSSHANRGGKDSALNSRHSMGSRRPSLDPGQLQHHIVHKSNPLDSGGGEEKED